jgi:branched-chain amino acid transport system permease protein
MRPSGWTELLIAAILAGLAAFVPLMLNGYWLSIAVTMMMYIALSTSWVLFSGPTHYISLATGAFFGVGGYMVGAGMSDYQLSFWLMLAVAPIVAAVLAALIGWATLRLSGVYFVIFTLGLAEMIRNLVSWVQNNFLGSRGLYVLTDFRDQHLYWMLLLVAAVVYLLGWILNRSRIGFALRIIGNDETVARHVGINTATAKVILFTTTGFFAALVGAIIAPRWSYIEPNQVFSPELSFLVVIMALLGGASRLWGPLVGVIPFTILWEWVSVQFSNQSTLFLGLVFLLIVYVLPNGVVGRLEQLRNRIRAGRHET